MLQQFKARWTLSRGGMPEMFYTLSHVIFSVARCRHLNHVDLRICQSYSISSVTDRNFVNMFRHRFPRYFLSLVWQRYSGFLLFFVTRQKFNSDWRYNHENIPRELDCATRWRKKYIESFGFRIELRDRVIRDDNEFAELFHEKSGTYDPSLKKYTWKMYTGLYSRISFITRYSNDEMIGVIILLTVSINEITNYRKYNSKVQER